MVELAIYAFVAAFIFFRLYSSLGKASSINFHGGCATQEGPGDGRIPLDSQHESQDPELDTIVEPEFLESVTEGIEEVRSRDPSFSLQHFMSGSAAAFELIMKALGQGDVKVLSSLLSDSMYKSFEAEIQRRSSGGHVHEDVVVSVLSQRIEAAKVVKDIAYITVKFRTEQMNIVRDSSGTVVDGSVSKINVVEDLWTFEKDADSPSRKWYLSATR
ncbi:Tim44/TimA family putative adaptor protein [Candidatus Anaplasma sp. TIGMIC]|nr:Tim44/TimA family putative adaptor protein [Candidatus Anaplasma sp. TIGMIC]